MRILETFELTKEFRGIKPFKTEFRDGINLIIGENGSGKTSLFKLMTDKTYKDMTKLRIAKGCEGKQYRYLDTEKDNPRSKGSLQGVKADGFMFTVQSHWRSHGETMFPLVRAIRDFKDIPVLVDEPEAGVSLKHQKELLTAFRKAVKNGCQLFIATHSYVFIDAIKEAFSMDDMEWIRTIDYLDKALKRKGK